MIFRNLINNDDDDVKFIEIELAACIDYDILNLFKAIYVELSNKLDIPSSDIQNINFQELSKKILTTLESGCNKQNLIILIDEIPISEKMDYSCFVEYFSSILILKQLNKGLSKVKFVLASIDDPTKHIKPHQQKIHNQFKFIFLGNWIADDINKLVDLICQELSISFDPAFKDKLLIISKKSPRFVKKFFRNIVARRAIKISEYEGLLKETERELNQYNNE